MINNARGSHVSPGVYMKEVDITYSTQSLGQTTLGLVGETLMGPAFQPVNISTWNEFVEYFGETSPEKFPGQAGSSNSEAKYLKYELPYVAKSYLKESKQLEVCRVLGLSGYDAGDAWAITANTKDEHKYVIALLRSKATHTQPNGGGPCDDQGGDTLQWETEEVTGSPYTALKWITSCKDPIRLVDGETPDAHKITLEVTKKNGNVLKYPVSLNNRDTDYILNVLGTEALSGSAPIFVEEFYDLALEQIDLENITGLEVIALPTLPEEEKIDTTFAGFTKETYEETDKGKIFVDRATGEAYKINDELDPDLEKASNAKNDTYYAIPVEGETKTFIFRGKTYQYETQVVSNRFENFCQEKYLVKDLDKIFVNNEGEAFKIVEKTAELGLEKTYEAERDASLDAKHNNIYFIAGKHYIFTNPDALKEFTQLKVNKSEGEPENPIINNYYLIDGTLKKCYEGRKASFNRPPQDVSDYREAFRAAKTPWVISELRGQNNEIESKLLFRFHTISDGNAANELVKVSIQNIDLYAGTFDILVRDFYDTDKNPRILEKYTKCTMRPNSKNYVAYKIGTIDGSYELKSAYIMIEMNESDEIYNSVPCGFLGYPMRDYGDEIEFAPLQYNRKFYDNIKPKNQYFGFSDLVGIDVDTFLYKGKGCDDSAVKLTKGFHLDERISLTNQEKSGYKLTIMGSDKYKFDCITSEQHNMDRPGILFSEEGTIGGVYENKQMRKFTVCFYGGFDGWDIYRTERSNTNDFKVNKYRGTYHTPIVNLDEFVQLDLPKNSLDSDYYAYLAGIRTFSNPEAVDINIFATPGINWADHAGLSEDAISMIEDADDGRNGDAIYILSTPLTDDYKDVVDAIQDTGIDSSYAVTYWPWVKYYDSASQVYVNIPVTKDVVRNMAKIDRVSFPWFAPAGTDRGAVECVKATNFTRLPEENLLYENMINPVKTFAVDGVRIFGNKTLYSVDSPLNRVNVRRLMIRVKKLISRACRSLIFEPNDSSVRYQFESIVRPILDDVKDKRGIFDYKLQIDDSPEAIDGHVLPAVISIKPIPSLEYIDITFKITPTGASFEE